MSNNSEYIKNAFLENGIEISDLQAENFEKYYEMLVEKNKVMNLTAITEFEEVVRKHFIDSVLKVEIPSGTKSVIDVGTGAGFPGIPLKIVFPELNITLLDSLNKRVLFLEEVIKALNLKNIKAIHGRAEEAARNKELREKFDLVVSRAVANLSTLSEYCMPFVKQGGYFLSYKSDVSEELKSAEYAIKLLGGNIGKIKTTEFTLPGNLEKRTHLYIYKEEKTPKAYPRKTGTPSKTPLEKK